MSSYTEEHHSGHSSSDDEGDDDNTNLIRSSNSSKLTDPEKTMESQDSITASGSTRQVSQAQWGTRGRNSAQERQRTLTSERLPEEGRQDSQNASERFLPLWSPQEQASRSSAGLILSSDADSLQGFRRESLSIPPAADGPSHRRKSSASSASSASRQIGLGSSEGSIAERRDCKKRTFVEKAFKSPIISSLHRNETPKLSPREVIDYRSQMTAVWGIYWYLPALMMLAFIAGVAGTIGHHAFYSALPGKKNENQLLMVRVGTAFAFFIKACLAGAVVIAYKQRIWVSLRKREMKLTTIDALFGVIEDPLFFFTNPEIFKTSKVAALLAVVSWLIPIASVLSPSSLTSEVLHLENRTRCDVPTLNFSAENDYDYLKVKEYFGTSLAFYNHTEPNNTGSPLSYDMPSFINTQLVSQSVFTRKAVTPIFLPQECPRNVNCTYSIKFDGPGYKCETIEDGDELSIRAPFKRDTLAPNGVLVYNSVVDQGDFKKPNVKPADVSDPDWIVGTFHYEPELWIGYTVNTTKRLDDDNPWRNKTTRVNRWSHKLEAVMIHCVHYHVSYKVRVELITGGQNVSVTSVDYIRPIIDTEYGQPNSSNFIRPGQEGYKLIAVYHALGSQMRDYLKGSIKWETNRPGSTPPATFTKLSMTSMVDQRTSLPTEQFEKAMQKFYQDIIFTMWSNPILVVAKKEVVACNVTSLENIFQYHKENLWTGYSIVIGCTLISIAVGAMALRSNGIASDTLFSRVMVTTRNPTLDHLSRGACLGADPFPKELERTKLRFGVLKQSGAVTGLGLVGTVKESDRPEHCAFGTKDEISQIVKHGRYAGLSHIPGYDDRVWQPGVCRCEEDDEDDEQYYASCDEGLASDEDQEWEDGKEEEHLLHTCNMQVSRTKRI